MRMNGLGGLALLPDLAFLSFDLKILAPDVEPQTVVDAHILIGHPDQRKQCNNVSSPADIEHLKPGDDKKYRCHVVAETVLASK